MNAKLEFLETVGDKKIYCALLNFTENKHQKRVFGQDDNDIVVLKSGWNNEEYQQFLKEIDRDYDDGFGKQFLHGHIWYEDGSWEERVQYDGGEWWVYNKRPNIPEDLIRIDREREGKLNKLGIV